MPTASWSEAEWTARRARGLPAWDAARAQADTDYWARTRENEFFTANPDLQKQATLNLQTNAMFNPRSMIPSSYAPFGAGYKNPDTTGPAYPGAPPPSQTSGAPPTNAMLPPPTPLSPWQTQPKLPTPGGAGGAFNSELWGGREGPAPGANTPSAGGFTEAGGGGAFQPPAGFDVRLGSNDPEVNHQVYGTNYFPGNVPGWEGKVATSEEFFKLTPEQQGAYRQALAYQFSQSKLPAGAIPPLPGDPVGDPGYYPGKPPAPSTGYLPPGTPWPAGTTAPAPFDPTVARATPIDPSTTPAGGQTGGPLTGAGNAMTGPGNYGGGRGNYMGYGPNGGGLRVDPNYLPENWNYEDSPEFQWQLKQDLRGANRRLLAMGRSDSTGGINAMNNVESSLRAAEVDKAYGRAVGANTTNYGRYIGANTTNYGRTVGEDETGWNRATQLDNTRFGRENLMGEQDWNRNYQLANLGYDATRTGVQSGDQASRSMAILLSENGAEQAGLAIEQGRVSAAQIQSLLNSGWTYKQINDVFKGAANPSGGAFDPQILEEPAFDPTYGSGYSNNPTLQPYDFFRA